MIHSAVCVLEKYLFVQQVHCQLKANSPHVCLLKGGSEVHVDVHEPVSVVVELLQTLFLLQPIEHAEETLEGPLVSVDPEEVDLFQAVVGRQVVVPLEVATGALPLDLVVLVHNGLQDG